MKWRSELLWVVLFICCFLCPSSLGEDVGQCSGTKILREKEGVVVDHTTPNTNYSSDFPLICGWLIEPEDIEGTKYTTIQFNYIDLVNREDRTDYVTLYDGGDQDSPTLFALTGNQVPAPIVSSGRRVFVKFSVGGITEPGTSTGIGFKFTYSSGACPNDCDGHGYCFSDSCSCEGGFEGLDCSTTACSNDCGGAARGQCEKNADKAKEWCECTPGYYGGDCTSPFCEGISEFTASAGNFSDHHINEFGNEHSEHNSFCQWLIRPPSSEEGTLILLIQLHFNTFSTELDNDFVRVYDGEDSETAHLLGEFSGDEIPSDIFSATGVMLVTFETDIGVASEGFSCSYQVESKQINNVPQHHQMSDWLAAIIASFAFILGLVLGNLFFTLGANVIKSTEDEGAARRGVDEEEGQYSKVGTAIVAEDAGELLESPSPLLEEDGEEEQEDDHDDIEL